MKSTTGHARTTRILLCAVPVLGMVGVRLGLAQCPFEWLPGEGSPRFGGFGTPNITAATTWDPDGLGPLPERLVVSGDSLSIDTRPSIERIATWDGTHWDSLPWVEVPQSATVYNGELIVAAPFTFGGQQHLLARLVGSEWQPLGGGMTGGLLPAVFSMIEYNGDLIACGNFTFAEGATVNNIARWDGFSWSPLGAGVGGAPFPPLNCRALTVYDGKLVAAGRFTTAGGAPANRIAMWDGANWSPVGGGVTGPGVSIDALAVYHGELIMAGAFNSPTLSIARWNGSTWNPLGTGISSPVSSLIVYDGKLVAAGGFSNAGGVPVGGVAQWDGTSWQAVGVGFIPAQGFGSITVPLLRIHQGALHAIGRFGTAGPLCATSLAKWDGTAWGPVERGFDAPVYALYSNGSDLIAGGWFLNPDGTCDSNSVVTWTGTEWLPLASGVELGAVRAITKFNGDIVIGGGFTTAAGAPLKRIARWNGAVWQEIAGGISNGAIYALAEYHGMLYAGGDFTGSGVPGNGIVRLNGTTWEAVGGSLPPFSTVFALHVYHDELIAAGSFSNAGGVAVNDIARWNDSEWQALGSGIGNDVFALATYQDELIVAGEFVTAGGIAAPAIARWNGSNWSPLAPVFGGGTIRALQVVDDGLLAAGRIQLSPYQTIARVVRWDSTVWEALEVPSPSEWTEDQPYAIVTHEGVIIVGGTFRLFDGNPVNYLSRGSYVPAPADDADCDQILDGDDNCPTIANQGQEDSDGDGLGDVCDSNVPVPAVSTWGYVVLILLMLVGGTVTLQRANTITY